MRREVTALLALVVVLAGCSGDDPTVSPIATEASPSAVATTPAPAPSADEPAPTTEPAGPSVDADDQPVVDGTLTVAVTAVPGPAFVVLHRDEGGAPGPVVGHASVESGDHPDVVITLDEEVAADTTLWAMLHADAGERGTYEFPGPDVPLRDLADAVVMVPFVVTSG